jgi:two-component system, LuxR family, response regulator FixJ
LTPETKSAVIVIEDDHSVLRSLRRLISAAGFAVQTFDRPSALLQSNLPSSDACLVVDIRLPEMDGIELCETLAAAGRLLPVILITGHIDEPTRENARRANPVAVLIKPFSRAVLMDAISKALGSGTPSA